jgi:hypothetical protein
MWDCLKTIDSVDNFKIVMVERDFCRKGIWGNPSGVDSVERDMGEEDFYFLLVNTETTLDNDRTFSDP